MPEQPVKERKAGKIVTNFACFFLCGMEKIRDRCARQEKSLLNSLPRVGRSIRGDRRQQSSFSEKEEGNTYPGPAGKEKRNVY